MDIVSRAKNMILSPVNEWPIVAGESTSVGALYQGYIVQLAAIAPVATLIGRLIFGYRFGFGALFLYAIVTYALSLIVVFVIGWIAAKLAPMFGGTDNMDSGLKLAAYGSTAAWVGGIFHIVPALGFLSGLAALYGIYLFYTGATPVMNVPSGRVIGYLIALVVAWIVAAIVVGALVVAILGGSMGMMM